LVSKLGGYPIKKYLGTMTVQGEVKREAKETARAKGKKPAAKLAPKKKKKYAVSRKAGGKISKTYTRPHLESKASGIAPITIAPERMVARVLDLGVNKVVSLRTFLSSPKFEIDPEIQADLEKNFDFYRVTLVADFCPKCNLVFRSGRISVKLANDTGSAGKVKVYSISPLIVNSRESVTKKFGINPEAKLFDIDLNPGVSYADERTYEKVHPLIVGNYAAKDYASWDFKTDKTVDSVSGAQIVEFMIRQPANIKTEWFAEPDGELAYTGPLVVRGLKSAFRGKPEDPDVEPEKFTVPLDE
jgi:hypothetical protein